MCESSSCFSGIHTQFKHLGPGTDGRKPSRERRFSTRAFTTMQERGWLLERLLSMSRASRRTPNNCLRNEYFSVTSSETYTFKPPFPNMVLSSCLVQALPSTGSRLPWFRESGSLDNQRFQESLYHHFKPGRRSARLVHLTELSLIQISELTRPY